MVGSCRLSDTQESLESSLMEKENTLAKTCEKLELVSSLQEALSLKELQIREASDRLLHTQNSVSLLPLASLPCPPSLRFQRFFSAA